MSQDLRNFSSDGSIHDSDNRQHVHPRTGDGNSTGLPTLPEDEATGPMGPDDSTPSTSSFRRTTSTVRRPLDVGNTDNDGVTHSPNPLRAAGIAAGLLVAPALPTDTIPNEQDDSHDDYDDGERYSSRKRGPPQKELPSWSLWKDHDRGASGLATTRGFSSSARTAELIMHSSAQLPISELAPDLRKIGSSKEELASIYKMSMAFIKYRTDVCVPLTAATKLDGSACRAKIDQAASLMFSSEHVHCAICYSVMITLWNVHPDSAKANIISATVADYMHSTDAQVHDFLKFSAKGPAPSTWSTPQPQ